MLTTIYEQAREFLHADIGRQEKATDVSRHLLLRFFALGGVPDCIRSENRSALVTQMCRGWLQRLGIKTLFVGQEGHEGRGTKHVEQDDANLHSYRLDCLDEHYPPSVDCVQHRCLRGRVALDLCISILC